VTTANGTCHVFHLPTSVVESVFGSPAPSTRPAVITFPPRLDGDAAFTPASDVSVDDNDVNPVPVNAVPNTLVASVPTSISQWKHAGASGPAVPIVHSSCKIRDDVIRRILPESAHCIAPHVVIFQQAVLVAQAGFIAEFVVARTLAADGAVTHAVRFHQALDFRRSLKWRLSRSCALPSSCVSPTVAHLAAARGQASHSTRKPRVPVTISDATRAYWASNYEPVTHELPVVPFWRNPMVALAVKDPLPQGTPLPVALHSVADHSTLTRARKLRVVGKGSALSGARRISACRVVRRGENACVMPVLLCRRYRHCNFHPTGRVRSRFRTQDSTHSCRCLFGPLLTKRTIFPSAQCAVVARHACCQ
jgi:hypothetical protein